MDPLPGLRLWDMNRYRSLIERGANDGLRGLQDLIFKLLSSRKLDTSGEGLVSVKFIDIRLSETKPDRISLDPDFHN